MDVEDLTVFWDRARQGSLSTLETFEEDELGWSPMEGGYSVREIGLHIAHEEVIEIAYGIARSPSELPPPFPAGDFPTRDSIRRLWAGVHARTSTFLTSLTPHELNRPIELAWGETARPADIVLHVIEHEIHHRGELSLALGLLGREGLDA